MSWILSIVVSDLAMDNDLNWHDKDVLCLSVLPIHVCILTTQFFMAAAYRWCLFLSLMITYQAMCLIGFSFLRHVQVLACISRFRTSCSIISDTLEASWDNTKCIQARLPSRADEPGDMKNSPVFRQNHFSFSTGTRHTLYNWLHQFIIQPFTFFLHCFIEGSPAIHLQPGLWNKIKLVYIP